jgi:hypothetical protein
MPRSLTRSEGRAGATPQDGEAEAQRGRAGTTDDAAVVSELTRLLLFGWSSVRFGLAALDRDFYTSATERHTLQVRAVDSHTRILSPRMAFRTRRNRRSKHPIRLADYAARWPCAELAHATKCN